MVLLSKFFRPNNAKSSINFDKLKKEIAGWHFVNDIEMDYSKYTALNPNMLIFRNYVNDKGHMVQLVVVYHQNDRWGAHDPTICYNSQGWKIIEKPIDITIPFNDRFLGVKKLIVKKGKIAELVYYTWFSSDKKITPSRNKQMLDMVLTGLIHGYTESGFLRFSNVINPLNQEESVAELNDFTLKFTETFFTESQQP